MNTPFVCVFTPSCSCWQLDDSYSVTVVYVFRKLLK